MLHIDMEKLFDCVAMVALEELSVEEAVEEYKEICGVPERHRSKVFNTKFSNEYTSSLVDWWATYASKNSSLMKMFTESDLDEWMDIFCYDGTIRDFIEGGKYLKESCVFSEHANKTVKDYEDKIRLTETLIAEQRAVCTFLENKSQTRVWSTPVKKKDDGFVYLIRGGSYCKIGITKDVKARLSSLRTSNPLELELLCSYGAKNKDSREIESYLHEEFKEYRRKGEWFELDMPVAKFEEMCRQFDI